MKDLCLCDEHKQMITEMALDQLIAASNFQSGIISQIETLIEGLDDPLFTIAAPILTGWEGTPIVEVLDTFKKYRDNAKKIFDIVQEEIKKRLDVPPSHRNSEPFVLVPAKEGHRIMINDDGSYQYIPVDEPIPLATLHAKE